MPTQRQPRARMPQWATAWFRRLHRMGAVSHTHAGAFLWYSWQTVRTWEGNRMDELRVRVHADLQTSTISVEEAAAALGQSTDVIWRYVRAGDLAHIRVQGSEAIEYRILAEDVHDL